MDILWYRDCLVVSCVYQGQTLVNLVKSYVEALLNSLGGMLGNICYHNLKAGDRYWNMITGHYKDGNNGAYY